MAHLEEEPNPALEWVRVQYSADYARDLAVSYSKLGDLHLAQGAVGPALEFYQKALKPPRKTVLPAPCPSKT